MMHRIYPFHSPYTWLATLALASTLTGCGQAAEEEFAQAVVTSALQSERNDKAGGIIVDSVEQDCVDDPALAAQQASERPPVALYPAECVTKTADDVNLHVEFDGCTGPFGRVTLAGGVDATFQNAGECKLHVDIVDSGDLTANGHDLDYTATADVTLLEDEREVDWHASFQGTTRRGKPIRQTSDLDVIVEDSTNCRDIVGTARGRVGDRDYRTTIESLYICPGECPASGKVSAFVTGRWRDRSITVRFDGSNRAQVKGWTGREFEVDMVCGVDETDSEAE